MKNFEPAVVVVAYNRVQPLQRLLKSLEQASYPEAASIPLVISIDFSDSPEVRRVAEEFQWAYGPKRVLCHGDRLGLRAHILKCGDLSEEFGSLIILEDDLTVSPGFYDFTLQAMPVYAEDSSVCGISLYQIITNPEYKKKGFEMMFSPLNDGFDNFFIQHVSTWGQCWTLNQWREFRAWLNARPADAPADNELLSRSVRSWPDSSSWAKYFQQYMVERGKYFVFPRISLSTNWGDEGTNFRSQTFRYQVPLLLDRRQWRLCKFDQSSSIYDAHLELEPACFKRMNPELEAFDFETDLYSVKEVDRIQKPYLLTSRESEKGLLSFGGSMFPLELNVIFKSEGTAVKLVKTTELLRQSESSNEAGPEAVTVRVQSFQDNLNKVLAYEPLVKDQKNQIKTLEAELRILRHERENWLIRALLWLRKFIKKTGAIFKGKSSL